MTIERETLALPESVHRTGEITITVDGPGDGGDFKFEHAVPGYGSHSGPMTATIDERFYLSHENAVRLARWLLQQCGEGEEK